MRLLVAAVYRTGPGCWPGPEMLAGVLLGAAALSACADEAPPTVTAGPAPAQAPPTLELRTRSLPRLDSQTRNERIDMALLTPGRTSVGVTMGMAGPAQAPYPPGSAGNEGLPGVNLGLQWRHRFDGERRVDITAWRDMGAPTDAASLVQSRQPGYGARVELNLGSQRSSGLVTDLGFVGLQLEGGARITVRRNGGKPMLYYRTKF